MTVGRGRDKVELARPRAQRLDGPDGLAAQHLRELLIADRIATASAAGCLLILMLATEVNMPFVLLITTVATMGLIRQLGLRALPAGRTDTAVKWFAVGSWGVSLGAVWIIPIALPILVITLAIPAVLAAMYLNDRQVRLITTGLFLATVAAGAISRWADGAGLEDRTCEIALPRLEEQPPLPTLRLAGHVSLRLCRGPGLST